MKLKSIRLKMLIPLSLMIIIVMVFFSSYRIYELYKSEINEINTKAKNIINIASFSLSYPIWTFTKEGVYVIGDSILNDSEIGSVKIHNITNNEDSIIYDKVKNSKQYNELIYLTNVIKMEDRIIGKIEIGLTKWFKNQSIIKSILEEIALIISIVIIEIILISLISKIVTRPIQLISNELLKIAEDSEVDLEKKLCFNTRDEIEHLSNSFNKIQDKFKTQIEIIKRSKDAIIGQEKLASIGIMIGGIAHNLRTPIITISGSLDAVKNLAIEYKDSIIDPEVDISDHYEISSEMINFIEKSKEQCKYMSDIITAIKEQVSSESDKITKFIIHDAISRVQLLMKSELVKSRCKLEIKNNLNESKYVNGSIGGLVQVINNLISNSIHAYGGKEGIIEVILEEEELFIIVKVKDYGRGIPKDIQKRLFKDMVTTKGKEGTGIGLYVSYSTIVGKFNGDIVFDSEEGVGTTIEIKLNKFNSSSFNNSSKN